MSSVVVLCGCCLWFVDCWFLTHVRGLRRMGCFLLVVWSVLCVAFRFFVCIAVFSDGVVCCLMFVVALLRFDGSSCVVICSLCDVCC